MAESLSTRYDLSHNESFLRRVEIAIVASALVVRAEGATPNHALRDILAKAVLEHSSDNVRKFAIAAVADITVNSTITDGALISRMADIWDAMS